MTTSAINGLIILLSLFAFVLGSPYVIHEKRDGDLTDTRLTRRRVEEDALLPMRIALTQNEHAQLNAEQWLMDVSDPKSKNYGRHWTQEEVVQAFQPSRETIENVTAWLHEHEIYDFTHSSNKQWFAFDIPASKAEQMLRTEYFEHETEHGVKAFCDYYHLPKHLQAHIHYVKPGIQTMITRRTKQIRRFATDKVERSAERRSVPAQSPTKNDDIPPSVNATSLELCWKYVTAACIRALNNISIADPKLPISPNNSMGLFEYNYQDLVYQPSLDKLFRNFAPEIPQGTSPFFKPIAGTLYPENSKNYSTNPLDGAEVEMDLGISLPIIYPQNATTLTLETGNPVPALDIWLDALDGSYCKVKQPKKNGGNGTLQCGIYTPPNVIALPYDIDEQDLTTAALHRQCSEYLKLGLQGVSIFFSSSDYGVGVTVKSVKGHDYCAKDSQFGPAFPASCPWITSVGATMIPEHGTVADVQMAAEWNYMRHNYVYGSSGGGFSNTFFPPPSYQKKAVAAYLTNHSPKWPYYTDGHQINSTGRYNRNGRGFRDISAVGTNVVEFVNEKFVTDNGTSCSSPLIAAIFNRIIEERIRAGKKGPLGFVNPVLYQHPEMFQDVVKGGNGFCSPNTGFQAVPGWDPVTGLGVPSFPKLLDVFLKLP